jgi:FtsP/CotA-like multicopper oxidase with cupredoxin domain
MRSARFDYRSIWILAALLCVTIVLPAWAGPSPAPQGQLISDPVPFQWTYHPVTANNPAAYYSGTLEVGEATFAIAGETLTTRAYRQAGGNYSIPGPTFTMVPGNKYVLRFHNTLPYEAPSPQHNVFKDANISNLHTHGLHISGESPGDDVTRFFEGGFGGDFVWDIPADHMGGTYWYHAHHHGSTFLQVAGGAFGLIIIDDANDSLPANVAAMEERQLVLGFLDPDAAGTGGDTLMSGTLQPTWTVNGVAGGAIAMPPDTWQHFRVLIADRDAMERDVTFGPECEVVLLARDGVWRTSAPKQLLSNSIELTGASRADFAVRTALDSYIEVNGTTVATILASGTPDPTPHPYASNGFSQWSASRPSYLRDLRAETGLNFESISMGARTINGEKFDADVPTFSVNADQVQEWSVSGANQHPFHLHIYHFQAMSSDGDFEEGEYYDTIAAKTEVRFDLSAATGSPYAGRTILHCHILGHEDRGAMGWVDVIGGTAAPTFPADGNLSVPYAEYYALGGGPPSAPSGLSATAVSSSAIDLSWNDNLGDEDGFDIERSLDGLSFSLLATVNAGVTTYQDTGLAASTTYSYRVSAYNGSGNSAWSNVASATTQGGGVPTSVEVGSIAVETAGLGGGQKVGVATVVVVDDLGNPVSGAVVTGDFTGTIIELGLVSGPTDATGTTVLQTVGTAKGKVRLKFCVNSITHPTLQNFVSPPGTVCGEN